MSLLIFAAALVGIVVVAIVVNRITGTRASYIDALRLHPGENEIWRDTEADVARVPRAARPLILSFPRLRRHTVVWTERRIVIAQRALFSQKRMITHEVHFQGQAGNEARAASGEALGGFFGRGFETIIAVSRSFGRIDDKPCVLIKPTEKSSAKLNLEELLIFSDRLPELEARVQLVTAQPPPAPAT